MHNKVVVFLSSILLCIVVAILAYYLVNKVPERELYNVLKKSINQIRPVEFAPGFAPG